MCQFPGCEIIFSEVVWAGWAYPRPALNTQGQWEICAQYIFLDWKILMLNIHNINTQHVDASLISQITIGLDADDNSMIGWHSTLPLSVKILEAILKQFSQSAYEFTTWVPCHDFVLYLNLIADGGDFCCRLHPNNVLGIRNFGEQLMEQTIVNCSNSYINRHFGEVSR